MACIKINLRTYQKQPTQDTYANNNNKVTQNNKLVTMYAVVTT